MRSSISAQSLASVPPSRALIVRIAPAASWGPLSRALSSRSSTICARRWTSRVDLRRHRFVFLGHLEQRRQVFAAQLHFFQRADDRLERFQLADHLLSRLLVVPETRAAICVRFPRSVAAFAA